MTTWILAGEQIILKNGEYGMKISIKNETTGKYVTPFTMFEGSIMVLTDESCYEEKNNNIGGHEPIMTMKLNDRLIDVAKMNPRSKMGNQSNGNYSVTKHLVYFGMPRSYFKNPDNITLESVCCIVHGAMLAVSKLHNGSMLYRCESCNNGGILAK